MFLSTDWYENWLWLSECTRGDQDWLSGTQIFFSLTILGQMITKCKAQVMDTQPDSTTSCSAELSWCNCGPRNCTSTTVGDLRAWKKFAQTVYWLTPILITTKPSDKWAMDNVCSFCSFNVQYVSFSLSILKTSSFSSSPWGPEEMISDRWWSLFLPSVSWEFFQFLGIFQCHLKIEFAKQLKYIPLPRLTLVKHLSIEATNKSLKLRGNRGGVWGQTANTFSPHLQFDRQIFF